MTRIRAWWRRNKPGKRTVSIHITAQGGLTDANQLAKQLAPPIRSALLQQRRNLGQTPPDSGLGLS